MFDFLPTSYEAYDEMRRDEAYDRIAHLDYQPEVDPYEDYYGSEVEAQEYATRLRFWLEDAVVDEDETPEAILAQASIEADGTPDAHYHTWFSDDQNFGIF